MVHNKAEGHYMVEECLKIAGILSSPDFSFISLSMGSLIYL